jgi:ATP-dependent DNA ligase
VAAVAVLPARSWLIDGEAIVGDDSGLAVFELIPSWPMNLSAVLCAFDLLGLDGEDLTSAADRGAQSRVCPAAAQSQPGIALNTH